MKAFLIARVSTDEQADALPAQVYRLKDYAQKMAFDYELFELKESAYKGDRLKFNEVLSRVFKVDEIIALVFDKVDRYSRDSSSDEVRLLNSLCESGKIELHFSSDHLVITKDSSAGQRLMLTMNTAFSQYYSNAISDNVKRRNEQMRRDGIWTGKAPFGYVNVPRDGKKWIDVDPLTSSAVKDAFSLYGSGLSTLREIKKHWLNKYNIISPISTIDKVLKNPFYYGTMRVQDRFYNHHYDTLISEEEFNKAKQVRIGYKIKPHKWGGLPFPYRGMIDCSDCGCIVTFENKKQKYVYGRCTQSKGKHGASYVTEKDLTTQLEDVIKRIAVPEVVCEQILTVLNKDQHKNQQQTEASRTTLESEIVKLEKRIDRLYEDHIDEKIDEDLYKRKTEDYKQTIKKHKTQLNSFELSSVDQVETVSHLLEVSKNAHKLFKIADYQEKRKILKTLLSNLELKGKQLRWELRKPFDLMLICNNNSTWQGLRDDYRTHCGIISISTEEGNHRV